MAQAQEVDYCARHMVHSAVARCYHCGNPFCRDCRVEDVSTEEEFCSAACRERHVNTRPDEGLATPEELIQESKRPILPGWRLWGKSLPALCRYGLPYAVGASFASWITEQVGDPGLEPSLSDISNFWTLLVLGYGIALAQVILSKQHTGLARGNPFGRTLERFVPWVITNVAVFALTLIGTLALIVPGIYLGIRLFWADEFALVHRASPLDALKRSWHLTEGEAGSIFHFQFWVGLSLYLLCVPVLIILWAAGSVFELLGSPAFLEWLVGPLVFFVFFLGYGALHGPEVVHFYSMRAEQSLGLRQSKILGID